MDAKEQKMIEARDEAKRKWVEAARINAEANRKQHAAYRKWDELARAVRDHHESKA